MQSMQICRTVCASTGMTAYDSSGNFWTMDRTRSATLLLDFELQLRDALQENCDVLVFWIVRGHVGETRVGMTQVMKIAAM
jgi:hypothetical protein